VGDWSLFKGKWESYYTSYNSVIIKLNKKNMSEIKKEITDNCPCLFNDIANIISDYLPTDEWFNFEKVLEDIKETKYASSVIEKIRLFTESAYYDLKYDPNIETAKSFIWYDRRAQTSFYPYNNEEMIKFLDIEPVFFPRLVLTN
jgi:hypothetical protein